MKMIFKFNILHTDLYAQCILVVYQILIRIKLVTTGKRNYRNGEIVKTLVYRNNSNMGAMDRLDMVV